MRTLLPITPTQILICLPDPLYIRYGLGVRSGFARWFTTLLASATKAEGFAIGFTTFYYLLIKPFSLRSCVKTGAGH